MVRAGFRNGYMLLLFILSAVGLNEIILLGNDLIAQAADGVLDGQQVDFSTFIIPLLWMIVLGTAASYCKSIFGNHYSAMGRGMCARRLENTWSGCHFLTLTKRAAAVL